MQLFIYPPEGPPKARLWALRPGHENFASRQRCQVRMGGLFAEDTGEGFRLVMPMKDMGIDITIRNLVRGWNAFTILRFTFVDLELGTAKPVPYAFGSVKLEGPTPFSLPTSNPKMSPK